jgi:hypothetical protein
MLLGSDASPMRTMGTKKRRKTIEEMLGREYLESHERAQKLLRERIAYHERNLAAQQSRRRLDSP